MKFALGKKSRISILIASCLAVTCFAMGAVLYDWEPEGYNLQDGETFPNANWTTVWLGFGEGKIQDMKLWLRPAPATRKGETHSGLVESEFLLGAEWDVSVFVRVDEQLRTRSWSGGSCTTGRSPAPPW